MSLNDKNTGEEKFRSIFENAALGIFRSTPEGRYEDVNQSFARILGFESPEKLLTEVQDISTLYKHPEDRENIKKAFAKNGFVEDYIVVGNHPVKKTVWISINAKQYQRPDGKVYYEGTIQDITERKIAEDKLKVSKEEISRILENSLDGILLTAPDGSIYSANPAACRMFGRSEKEICEAGREGLVDLSDPRLEDFIKTRREKGKAKTEMTLIRNDGSKFAGEVSSAIFKDNDGKLKTSMIIRDISTRKKSELEEKESRRRLDLRKTIAEAFVLEDKSKMYHDILYTLLKHMNSRFGYFGYIDRSGDLVASSMTQDIWEDCEVEEKSIIFPKESWAGLWGESLKTRKSLIKNSMLKVPNGHVPLNNAMVGVIEFQDKLIGQLAFANSETDYTKAELDDLEEICHYISPLLNAELNQEQHKIELIEARERAEASEKKLIEAQELSHVGSWEYYIDTDVVTWSKELFNIFERPHDLSVPRFTEQAPFYSEESFARLKKAVEDCIQHEIPYEIDLDIITSSGSVEQIISKGDVLKDEDEKVIGCHGTAQDVTEQKKIEREFIEAKERAEESDRLKSAFLTNMSHEIRTPMNGIIGFVDLLQKPDFPGEQKSEFIKVIEKSSKRLLDTVGDLVDISKIETGQVELIKSELDVSQLLQSLYDFFLPEAKQKGLELTLEQQLPEARSIILTDKVKFQSIITNLIKNALKYTPTGSVKNLCRADGKDLLFYVKDTGIGIPSNRQQAIFDRFVQADVGDKRAFEGSGLGLSIVKAYSDMLGGRVWLDSEEEKGSTFYFSLPFEVPASAQIDTVSNPDTESLPELKPLKILVAEDDDVSRYHLEILLKDSAKEMLLAHTGKEAVRMFRDNKDIDLILMDLKMPEMDGYEATKRIREINDRVPIIAQTAYAMSGDKEKAQEAGCDDYVTKPVDEQLLLSKIKRLLS